MICTLLLLNAKIFKNLSVILSTVWHQKSAIKLKLDLLKKTYCASFKKLVFHFMVGNFQSTDNMLLLH